VISGARQARPSWLRRLVAGAAARQLSALVVPGPDMARARGLDLEAAGLEIADTPRHASVLVLIGDAPESLKKAAAVAYAQMPRPRVVLAAGVNDISPLPAPDISVSLGQEAFAEGVTRLRRSLAENAFSVEVADFDVEAVRTETEYVCPMHPEVVSDELGSCPECGMDLVPREAARGVDHGHMDHSGHEGMEHGHEKHEQVSREHSGHGGHDDTGHGATNHGGDSGGHEAHGHAETRHSSHEEHDSQGGANHEDMEHGGQHEGHAGMEHEEAAEDHVSHDGMNHSHMDHGEHQEHGEGSGEHAEHGGHGHMDHGDMGFMSMVEMTKDLPRSPDGLPMEWVEAPFGPLFPGLPGGLSLTLTLDGDTVAEADAEVAVGQSLEGLVAGPAEDLADRLSRHSPLSPVAYRLLAVRAVESVTGASHDERTELVRVGALERERTASHLNWLAGFAHLLGYAWLERRAVKLQLAVLRAEGVEEIARLRAAVGSLARRVERTPLLRRKLGGIGRLPQDADTRGPVARAVGREDDLRVEEDVYRELGFEPVVRDGGEALSRLRVRLEEIERSMEIVGKAGSFSTPTLVLDGALSGAGTARIETPRGTAELRVELEEGVVSRLELDAPSSGHLELVKPVAEGEELADALVGIASLDLSPWEVVR
jgi:Ni,Fe-hydrogenase III large subunit